VRTITRNHLDSAHRSSQSGARPSPNALMLPHSALRDQMLGAQRRTDSRLRAGARHVHSYGVAGAHVVAPLSSRLQMGR